MINRIAVIFSKTWWKTLAIILRLREPFGLRFVQVISKNFLENYEDRGANISFIDIVHTDS